MTPILAATVAFALVSAVLGAEWVRQPRPQHAGAGAGALTVAQLLAQADTDATREHIVWPRTDPDAPARHTRPDGDRWLPPTRENLRRVLDGLHRL